MKNFQNHVKKRKKNSIEFNISNQYQIAFTY